MKNREIIANAAVQTGILTAEEAKDALENGGEIPLHTLQGWNLRGSYRVKSGEEGISVKLWRKRENEDRFYLARAYLYRFEQLEES